MRTAVYNRYWSTGGGAEKYGGVIAQVLAARHPRCLDRLVLEILVGKGLDDEIGTDRMHDLLVDPQVERVLPRRHASVLRVRPRRRRVVKEAVELVDDRPLDGGREGDTLVTVDESGEPDGHQIVDLVAATT